MNSCAQNLSILLTLCLHLQAEHGLIMNPLFHDWQTKAMDYSTICIVLCWAESWLSKEAGSLHHQLIEGPQQQLQTCVQHFLFLQDLEYLCSAFRC